MTEQQSATYEQHTVATECWTVVADADNVPNALRHIAERLESADAALLGLWSTGFGGEGEAVIQVIVDVNPDQETSDA